MGNKIVAFGEVLFDLIEGREYLGGAPLNAAALARQLSDPTLFDVAIVSRIGTDERGERAYQRIKGLGIDVRALQLDPTYETGIVTVSQGGNGESYEIHPAKAFDRIEFNDTVRSVVRDADIIIFGSLSLRSPSNLATLQAILHEAPRAIRLCDINLRKDCYTKETLRWCLDTAQILKLNSGEVTVLRDLGLVSADTVETFISEVCSDQARSVSTCLVTQGKNGVTVGTREITGTFPGISIDTNLIKDTVGCGDAVTAAFSVRLLEGASILEAAELANSAGAFAATHTGGIYPTDREKFESFLANTRAPLRFVEVPRQPGMPVS